MCKGALRAQTLQSVTSLPKAMGAAGGPQHVGLYLMPGPELAKH